MRIVDIREGAVSLRSDISNAFISFAEMDASIVALVTDVVRDGRPAIGYGFHSNGRYAQRSILRERLIPSLLTAETEALLNDAHDNFDPGRMWAAMMRNEKPGGRGERSVAVGTLDMAIWDAVAKIEEQPLYRVLADRYGNGSAEESPFVYAAGGYYYPGKDLGALQEEMRSYLDLGYTVVKMKIGGASLSEDRARGEAVLHRRFAPRRDHERGHARRRILFGAMGLPHVRISDGREIAPQLDLRERLHLYAGVRSVKAIAGLPLPLADPRALEVDFVLVRESTERLFAERESGTMKPAGEARDSLVISRAACERPFDFTFALARVGGPAEDRAA